MRMVPDRIAMGFPIRTVATKPELTDERCSWTIGSHRMELWSSLSDGVSADVGTGGRQGFELL